MTEPRSDSRADVRAAPDWRLRAYRRLSEILVLRSYTAKVFLLAFATTHIPLIALVAYIIFVTELPADTVWQIVVVTLIATLVGTALALVGLEVMLAPVISASRALVTYRQDGIRPTLPTDIDDGGGQLLTDVQHTLVVLDELLTQANDLAASDGLTGLFNRREAERRLEEELAATRSNGGTFALLIVDANELKDVNDRWGHAAGDSAIQHLASVIIRQTGTDGWVARWGGDEFVVWCADAAVAHALLKRITATLLTSPVPVSSDVHISASISGGIASSCSTDTVSDLVERADVALYGVKRSRGLEVMEPPHGGRSAHGRITDLRHAINREQLVLHYQPVVNLGSGNVDQIEALIRLQHPVYGLVSPDEFLPLADEIEQSSAIGHWVFDEVCRQLDRWGRNGPAVAINVSATQFRDPDFIQNVSSALAASVTTSPKLWVEITEHTLIEDLAATVSTLNQLHALGVGVTIDDFGAGYSSLHYLQELPVDAIKLDRKFVHALTSNARAQAIVEAIVSLAHVMGLTVTAEGIETVEQLALLRRIGCERGQGFLLAKPASASGQAPVNHIHLPPNAAG